MKEENKNKCNIEGGVKSISLFDMTNKKLIIENNIVTGIQEMTYEEIKQSDIINAIDKAMREIEKYDDYTNGEYYNPHDDVWDILNEAKKQFIKNIENEK